MFKKKFIFILLFIFAFNSNSTKCNINVLHDGIFLGTLFSGISLGFNDLSMKSGVFAVNMIGSYLSGQTRKDSLKNIAAATAIWIGVYSLKNNWSKQSKVSHESGCGDLSCNGCGKNNSAKE